MAGQLSFGSAYNNAGAGQLRECKAFGEGIAYRASGTVLSVPKTDNPHESNSDAALAWALGWDLAEANVGFEISKADLGSTASVGVVPA